MVKQHIENIYDDLSKRRKELQEQGLIPDWYSTAGLQMFEEKYQYEAANVREQFQRIANTAAKHLADIGMEEEAREQFFSLLWKGWLSPSTPVLANTGTKRGLPVSCSGGVVRDSIDGFYSSRKETALLTKHGFGTSAYLGDIRPRGSDISVGGKASGVLPVMKGFVQDMRDVAQGTARRGAWAGYLPIDHGDFREIVDYILAEPDDVNIGWNITNAFIERLNNGDKDALDRFKRAMYVKMVTGKGYFFFVDKANEKRPEMYKKHNLTIKNSNLCSEIMLHSSEQYSFTCILSSMNLAKYDEWKGTDAVYWATIFLDCICQEFLEQAKWLFGIDNARRFTENGRALGLGACGWHTLLQKRRIPFDSLDAMWLTDEVFGELDRESLRASTMLAEKLGEPEWCEGFGVRNTHRIAIAPTKSTALLMGGVSEGINPDPAMVYSQTTSAGEVDRVNPELLEIMKERDVYNKKTINSITEHFGSVQHVSWLSEDEKKVFKTAFEINQEAIVRLASRRAKFIDQWQSLNLFFAAGEDEEWIAKVHKQAFLDPNILALYYVYSMAGVQGSQDCEACQ